MADEKPWKDVIETDRLEKNWVTRVEVGTRLIAVYDTPTGVFASLALCNHGGADLCDGNHRARFSCLGLHLKPGGGAFRNRIADHDPRGILFRTD